LLFPLPTGANCPGVDTPVLFENSIRRIHAARLIWWVLVDLFRPRAKLEAEILVLRQQINVLRRTAPKRLLLSSIERQTAQAGHRCRADECSQVHGAAEATAGRI
jgi:hypothetical protein